MLEKNRSCLPTTDLIAATKELRGVGLAANQVGDARRYCVMAIPDREPFVMVNPEIIERSKEEGFEDEGCLSLPGVAVAVARPLSVRVKWEDVEGQEHEEEFGGFAARVVCHEDEHLRGGLIFDHLTIVKRRKLMAYIDRALRMERENLKAIAENVGRLSPHAVDIKTAVSRRQVEKLIVKGE